MSFPGPGSFSVKNDLLANLPVDDTTGLASAVRTERLGRGVVLSSRMEPATDVWFPQAGVVSLSFTDNNGRSVQTGMVGREGCAGVESLFTGVPVLAEAVVLIEGDMAAIPAAQLRSAMIASPPIQHAVSRFLYAMAAQSLQTVACNRLHSLQARCCRWLLMTQDRIGRDDLPLTQEGLARMLGSGRPRINILLAMLEHDGLVCRSRGRIHLRSRARLEERACECYRLLRHVPRWQADAVAPSPTGP